MRKAYTTGKKEPPAIPPAPYLELLVSFVSQIHLFESEIQQYRSLCARGLPPLVRTLILATLLGTSPKLLSAMALFPDRYYRSYVIFKRTGGTRQIDAPRVFLKTVQRWILFNILYMRPLPPYVTGFVPGRSLLDNGAAHLGSKYMIKMDLSDFFPSVNTEHVKGVYASFGYPERVANFLSRLTTLNNCLPQGAPTSPYLANLVFLHCDKKIHRICTRFGVRYSRYADDLTFSSDTPMKAVFLKNVQNTIKQSGFRINREKFRRWRPGQRLITTGMVVHEKVQPTRQLRRRLRAMFHQAKLRRRRSIADLSKLQGWAAFVNMYNRALGRKYLSIVNSLRTKRQR